MLESTIEEILSLGKSPKDRKRLKLVMDGLFLRTEAPYSMVDTLAERLVLKRSEGSKTPIRQITLEEAKKKLLNLTKPRPYYLENPNGGEEPQTSWRGYFIPIEDRDIIISYSESLPTSDGLVLSCETNLITSDPDLKKHHNIELLKDLRTSPEGVMSLTHHGEETPYLATFDIRGRKYNIPIRAFSDFVSLIRERRPHFIKDHFQNNPHDTLANHLVLLYRFLKRKHAIVQRKGGREEPTKKYKSKGGLVYTIEMGEKEDILSECRRIDNLEAIGYELIK